MGACGFGAWWLITKRGSEDPGTGKPKTGEVDPKPTGKKTELRIAYGTEKKNWLKWAVEEFEATKEGKDIQVTLIPMGSLEGARATVKGEEEIHVWSPASSAYRDVFVTDWQLEHSGNPIAREETLALSPMVFVMWKERYDAFVSQYNALDFETLSEAMVAPGGWNDIAQKPEWGFFKFGHTNPTQSNSGLISLTLMAHHYYDKTTPLEAQDIVNAPFQTWLKQIEGSVSGLINSTGNMMRDMVLKGPASYDVVLVYENLAIDYLKNAEGRWGQLYVVYPKINLWNDNPYYIIDAPWVEKNEKKAAETFLEFLMSEPIQQQSLVHGFRPGNPSVPVIGPESPFEKYKKYGLQIAIDTIAEPPRADAINNLLTGWQRLRSSQ
ncbi:MAG: hypothetical protein CMO55_18395 [Verrucomicrobiales bacterium]|nr:hypothetical protein [Verrucomicrobiales bacterium]